MTRFPSLSVCDSNSASGVLCQSSAEEKHFLCMRCFQNFVLITVNDYSKSVLKACEWDGTIHCQADGCSSCYPVELITENLFGDAKKFYQKKLENLSPRVQRLDGCTNTADVAPQTPLSVEEQRKLRLAFYEEPPKMPGNRQRSILSSTTSLDINIKYKQKLQEKLKAQSERERVLQQIKADHGYAGDQGAFQHNKNAASVTAPNSLQWK